MMTAKELRRLAEIAGLTLSAVGELLQSGSRFYRPNNEGKLYPNPVIPVYEWQPHLNIEQAWLLLEQMVRNGGAPALVNDDNGKWAVLFNGFQPAEGGPGSYAWFVDEDTAWMDTPAVAICRAAQHSRRRRDNGAT